MLKTSKLKYNDMIKLNDGFELVSHKEAEDDLKKLFYEAIDSDDFIWHIIKAQVGIGKTELYLDFIKNSSLRILIVVPTVKLKKEIRCDRAEPKGIYAIESPSIQEIKDDLPDEIWNDLQYLLNSGRSIIPYMKKRIRENDTSCSKEFKWYLRKREEFENFNGRVAVTTHKKLSTLSEEIIRSYDIIIVDEDIIFNHVIQNKGEITIPELKTLLKKISKTNPRNPLAKKIKEAITLAKTEQPFSLDEIEYSKKICDGIKVDCDIPAFCKATSFCLRKSSDDNGDNMSDDTKSEDTLVFMKPVEFPKDVKYIMLSATVNEEICNDYFGNTAIKFDNIEFINMCKPL